MKTKRVIATVLGGALLCAAGSVTAEELVARFSGSASGTTDEFEVHAPWIMEWVVSGHEGQFEVVEIGLIDASTGAYEGITVKSKTAGSGVRLFDKGGNYYFRVSTSLMNWHINVKEISGQEAKEYKPVH